MSEDRWSERVRVVHLTSAHDISHDSRILLRECVSLASGPYIVSLVATGAKPYRHDGVDVITVPPSRSRLRRLFSTVRSVYRAGRRLDADIYHLHDPELIGVGLVLKLTGRRVVYDVHEDMPAEVRTKDWIPAHLRPPVARVTALAESLAARRLDLIVAATPTIAGRFPPAKTVVVQNFPILAELTPGEAVPYAQRPASLVYIGDITAVRGAREMVRLMNLVPPGLNARLKLAGRVNTPGLEADLIAQAGADRVDFLGWQTRAGVRSLLASARAGLCILHPTANFVESQPTKLFEYMAAGLPIVASDFPRWREIVDGAGCGLLVDPLDPVAVATAVTWILEHPEEGRAMGNRGRQAAEERYSWESEARCLMGAYASLTP